MKKLIILILLFITTIVAAGSLAACHSHNLEHVIAINATCTTDGNIEYWHCDVCGKYFSDEETKNELRFEDTRIAKYGHKLTHVQGNAATCTQNGNIEYWRCSACWRTFSDENGTNIVYSITTYLLGHDFGNWNVEIDATCTQKGTEAQECSRCHIKNYRTIPMLSHTESNWITETASSCTVIGSEYTECLICHTELERRDLPVVVHSFVNEMCELCNKSIEELVVEKYNMAENSNNSLRGYVIGRADGFYDVYVIGSGDMKNYTENNSPFSTDGYSDKILNIYIDANTTSIGDYAFYECTSITEIIIPEKISKIGVQAFYNCASVTKVEFNAINCEKCSGFFNIGVNTDGFTLYIGNKVKNIPDSLFRKTVREETPHLVNIEFAENSVCERIGDFAFEHCSLLTSVNLPGCIKEICWGAFAFCTNLSDVQMDKGTTTYIGQNAFEDTALLNNTSNWEDKVLYIGDTLVAAKGTLGDNYIVKPDTKAIAEYAFKGCNSLVDITLPETLEIIGKYAFQDCTALKSINLPDTLSELASGTFSGCSSLEAINLPSTIEEIASGIFYNCSSLVNIVLPIKVKAIRTNAFYGCNSLNNIYVFDSIETIESNALPANYDNYNEYDNALYIGNPLNPYLVLVKAKDTTITSCEINEKTKVICNEAFYNCVFLSKINIPDNTQTVGDYAFAYCSRLTKIIIGKDISNIGEGAFALTGITTIDLKCEITAIKPYTFLYCSQLKNITIHNKIRKIEEGAFSNCQAISTVTYEGTQEQWALIEIAAENEALIKANVLFD